MKERRARAGVCACFEATQCCSRETGEHTCAAVGLGAGDSQGSPLPIKGLSAGESAERMHATSDAMQAIPLNASHPVQCKPSRLRGKKMAAQKSGPLTHLSVGPAANTWLYTTSSTTPQPCRDWRPGAHSGASLGPRRRHTFTGCGCLNGYNPLPSRSPAPRWPALRLPPLPCCLHHPTSTYTRSLAASPHHPPHTPVCF